MPKSYRNIRIPVDLHKRLSRIKDWSGVSLTRIAAIAIENHIIPLEKEAAKDVSPHA